MLTRKQAARTRPVERVVRDGDGNIESAFVARKPDSDALSFTCIAKEGDIVILEPSIYHATENQVPRNLSKIVVPPKPFDNLQVNGPLVVLCDAEDACVPPEGEQFRRPLKTFYQVCMGMLYQREDRSVVSDEEVSDEEENDGGGDVSDASGCEEGDWDSDGDGNSDDDRSDEEEDDDDDDDEPEDATPKSKSTKKKHAPRKRQRTISSHSQAADEDSDEFHDDF